MVRKKMAGKTAHSPVLCQTYRSVGLPFPGKTPTTHRRAWFTVVKDPPWYNHTRIVPSASTPNEDGSAATIKSAFSSSFALIYIR